METINNSSQINIDELLKESETVVSDSNGLIINDDENIGKIDEKPKAVVPKEYDGPGIVLEKKTKEERLKDATIGGVNKDTRGYVNDYIAEQNKEIAKAKAAKELMEEKGITPEELKAKGVKKVLTREELQEFKANPDPVRQVTIVVERGDLGKIEFTPEQQKLIETATKIVIEEKEQKQFRTLKLRKEPVKNKQQIIPQFFDKTLSPFIALGSGYMGKMKNCSTQDIMKLGRAIDQGNELNAIEERWQLLYEKMKFCSIGTFKTFEEFLKGTAYDDYENLQFALISASLPSETTLSFNCPNCKKAFTQNIKNEEFLRTELVSQEMADFATEILNSSAFEERAREVYEKAPFNQISRIAVDDEDSIILDLYAPSAYDAIYRIYKEINSEKLRNEDYQPYLNLVRMVKVAYLAADVDETGELVYDAFEEPDDILEILTRLNQQQLDKISIYTNETYLTHKYYYGIKDVKCPECGHNLGDFTMTMDNLLFLKLRPHQTV